MAGEGMGCVMEFYGVGGLHDAQCDKEDDNQKKMICWNPLLIIIILSSCLCAATFVVNVTQSSYQAEEKHNITLEWTFTTRPHGSWSQLFVLCSFFTSNRHSVVFRVHDGVEVPESQDEQISGRVQSDKDVLREGRIRLHVSRLRTEDSGLYVCEVETDGGSGYEKCLLNVSAAADQIQTQKPTLTPEAERRGRIFLFIPLTAAALMVLMIMLIVWFRTKKIEKTKTIKCLNKSEPAPNKVRTGFKRGPNKSEQGPNGLQTWFEQVRTGTKQDPNKSERASNKVQTHS
ncbi:uncharacterized protein LOC119772548 [Cyprinodon tularosa]|uniref:uncharacterized protein LOC119772548 n=1 Tax=Cyprinodon tularosa TaxID=77115 RepID=UPI0018E25DEC|nr:uncharacterized protein LOC119772548 [Cyprinodon tularosa]